MATLKPTLLILAAGLASRYGSRKQTESVGPHGETIIEYSVYDAIRAGFGKIVFVIHEDFAEKIQLFFEPRLKNIIPAEYVLQKLDLKKYGLDLKTERNKPWGTGHALLSAKEVINEPFCVINGDDFYGYEAYQKMCLFLNRHADATNFSLVSYRLDKTLSENGPVSRGLCTLKDYSFLSHIKERTKIYKKKDKIVFQESGTETSVLPDTAVSMNFWGFTPALFDCIEKLFKEFAFENVHNPKAEFFIPTVVEHLLGDQQIRFHVIQSHSQWFGLTYKEDRPTVKENISILVKNGTYPEKLWN